MRIHHPGLCLRLASLVFTLTVLIAIPVSGQSRDGNKPTPVVGASLRGVLRRYSTQISDPYYYSLPVRAGRLRVVLSFTPPEGGASISASFSGPICCSGDAYVGGDSGNTDPVTRETTFGIPRSQTLLLEVNVSVAEGKAVPFSLNFEGAVGGAGLEDRVGDGDGAGVTKTLTVDGKTGLKWVDTGIDVRAGDIVRISAKGSVDVGAEWGRHGPEGTDRYAPQPHGYYPVESKTRYALAARVTESGGRELQKWAYGDEREKSITRPGRLWLTVNDDAPDDNEGEFVATVTIVSPRK